MLHLGILGLGEGRSTMSAALQSKQWNLKMISGSRCITQANEKGLDTLDLADHYYDQSLYFL